MKREKKLFDDPVLDRFVKEARRKHIADKIRL